MNRNKLQEIYDLELNVTLSWFWDGGVDAILGDTANGIKASGKFETVEEAIDFLHSEALEYCKNVKAPSADP